MKSCYVSLRKNPAGSPENKKISYPGKGTRFGKHLFSTYLKIEYTLCTCRKIRGDNNFFDGYLSTLTRSMHFPAKKLSQLPGQLDASQ